MSDNPHLVLARKYRPTVFDELIGQEQLVRVLRNSFKMNKVAHGYILTGVRGVGKTTTARIIAKTLNCEKNNNKEAGAPINDPCGTCAQCQAIADYRHVDVQEMDAASHNKVDDVRAIIESVGYRPAFGRYRVYILDEAHMITTQAFNALLKTLEEPPPHLVFILATTEVQKIPATILSRCVRFDLRRVPTDQLTRHFMTILAKEKITMAEAAVRLIARAAEGSVRDGLSMLDQAIALNPEGVVEEDVLAMLGLSDITRIYQLFTHLMAGESKLALQQYHDLIIAGASPDMLLEQLMAVVHHVTKMALDSDYGSYASLSETERTLASGLAQKLALPILARSWQMLLKGLSEVRISPDTITATEMVLIRLLLVSDVSPPEDIIAKLNNDRTHTKTPSNPSNPSNPSAPSDYNTAPAAVDSATAPIATKNNAEEVTSAEDNNVKQVSFEDLVNMVAKQDMMLSLLMRDSIRLIDYHFSTPDHGGLLIFEKIDADSDNLANRLQNHLSKSTKTIWQVASRDQPGQPSLDEQLYDKIINHKAIKLAIDIFPKAAIINPKPRKNHKQ